VKSCDECLFWAQWKVEDEETKEIHFFCKMHKDVFLENHPNAKAVFCGVVIANT